MKYRAAILLCAVMMISLTACGGQSGTAKQEGTEGKADKEEENGAVAGAAEDLFPASFTGGTDLVKFDCELEVPEAFDPQNFYIPKVSGLQYIDRDIAYNTYVEGKEIAEKYHYPAEDKNEPDDDIYVLQDGSVVDINEGFNYMGRLELTNDWGKVVYTIASEHPLSSDFIGNHWLEFRFYHEILGEYTPLQLMTITVLLVSLICTFLGVLMFLISLFAARAASVSAAFTFVLAVYCVQNIHPKYKQSLSRFIPAYWGEVALIATPGSGYYRLPSLTYMFTFLLVTIAVMSVVICLRVKHMEFNWENEDV